MGLFKKLAKNIKKGVQKVGEKVASGAKGFKRDLVDSGALGKIAGVASKVVSGAGAVLTATGIGAGVGGALMGAGAGLGVASKALSAVAETSIESVAVDSTSYDLASLASSDIGGMISAEIVADSGGGSGGVSAVAPSASSDSGGAGLGLVALAGLALKFL